MKKSLPSHNAAQGFSLIELMISISIGLVIIVFVTSLYVRSKSSYELNDDNARVQQESRLILALIGRNLTQAGFGPPTGINDRLELETMFSLDPDARAFRACDNGFSSPANTADSTCAAGAGGPAFEVSYVVDTDVNVNIGSGTDCNGQEVPLVAGQRVVRNRFYLASQNGETQSLFCAGNGGIVGQPLLNNVEKMLLTYGLAVKNPLQPDSFLNSVADVSATEAKILPLPVPFKRVVSVNVCLQLSSSNNVVTKPQVFRDCAGAMVTSNDRKLHTVLNGTFTLRNNADTTTLPY